MTDVKKLINCFIVIVLALGCNAFAIFMTMYFSGFGMMGVCFGAFTGGFLAVFSAQHGGNAYNKG